MRRLLSLLIVVLALATPALAEEPIRSFVSEVTVNADASIDVTETITINSEGRQINHGIFRDFPTTYTDGHGQRVIVGFDVTGVTRDGRAEPYVLESLSNGLRIRIGDKDVWLDDAPHRYEISYRTTRQIGFFEKFDELYWNVTGNGWDFPIDRARVTITLPAGANIIQHDEFTGGYRSTENYSRVLSAEGNVLEAETTVALNPQQGFTVAVAWQKGLVTPPSDTQKWAWWASDNAGFFTLALGLLASALYFLFAWNKVGRDPPKGTIIPLFAPPKGLGPSAVRFVSRYGSDDKAFAAAMVGLAVKGRLGIEDDDRTFTITKLAGTGKEPLTSAESALYTALPSGSTELKQTNHASISAARSALDRALKNEFEGTAFLKNLGWFAVGLAISVLCLIIGAVLLPGGEGMLGLFAFGWMGIWWGVVLAVGWAGFKGLFAARGLWSKITSLGALLFLIPFAGGGIIAPGLIFAQGGGSPGLFALVGTAVLLGLINVVFYHLLRAPTQSGRQLMDQIEGFRLYLSTAEEERLKVLHPPEKTPELFERYLPYALALDCENEWNAKFATVLAAAAAAGAAAPVWYSGSRWDNGSAGGFTDSLGRSLASSAAAAATAPGRSSGSGGGGGGFSGGGGGGGGGGGW